MNEALLASLVERVVEMRTRGVVTARDTYAVMDAKTSMIMLSSKVNAIASVLINGDNELKQKFVKAWRDEFVDLNRRKFDTVRKIIDDDSFLEHIVQLLDGIGGVSQSQLSELRAMAHKANDDAEALELSVLDINTGLLDYDLL